MVISKGGNDVDQLFDTSGRRVNCNNCFGKHYAMTCEGEYMHMMVLLEKLQRTPCMQA